MGLSKCSICKSDNVTELFASKDYISGEEFIIYICKACGAGVTHPQPQNINCYYPANYRRFAAPVEWFLQTFYEFHVKKWMPKLGSSGRALEIGCGSGWMLRALHKQGWNVVGLERTEEEARFVSSLTGLKILSGDIAEIPSEPKYDLILLFNVLEHMTDPRDVLQRCKKLLKEDGVLILSTHNFDSWQAHILGPRWFHLDVPRHLFHFTPKALANLLEMEGLDIIQIKSISMVHDIYGWLQGMLNKIGFRQNRLAQGLIGGNSATLVAPSGVVMTVIAVLLTIPSFFLSLTSMLFGSGAIMEVWVKKKDVT